MPFRQNEYARIHRFRNDDSEMVEQYQDIDEYIARRCEALKIDWTRLGTAERLKLAKQFGCHREFVDSIQGRKHAI